MSYKVVSGDTLSGIASRFHVSLGALEAANKQIQNPNQIYVGESLNIPGQADSYGGGGGGGGGGQYTVRSGDTMSGIASRHGVSLGALMGANPQVKNPNLIMVGERLNLPGGTSAPAPAPHAPAPTPAPGGGLYTVRSGDTMSGIAARHGVSLGALESANPQVKNPNYISVGQVLHLPGSSHSSGPSAPAPSPAPSSGGSYIVRSGDTMSGIASKVGVSLGALEGANPQVPNPNVIMVGQVLHLPSGAHAPSGGPSGPSGPGPTTPVPTGPAPSGFHPLTPDEFRRIAPNLGSKAELYTPYLNQAMVRFGITTPKREAAFLAQITEETAGFDTLTEYASGAEYEGRADLGNTHPGDGVRYKGRGAIQLTGRYNYENYGNKLGLDLVDNPTKAADPSVAFLIAGQYWSDHGLNQLADQNDFIDITRRINGGTNGESAREYYWSKAKSVLGI